ncbi:DUF2267 domain-containing protein [Streptomyces sp. B6B3]|uniref:DUF2267 domain-containing protein n=1 Tax=Streptomyces sp. B6B3 TaxID=3153570 RepID=UPI00325C7D0E
MIRHEWLVETVADRAGLGRAKEADHVARTVLADLTLRLAPADRGRLERVLPPADRDAAFAVGPRRDGGAAEFLRDVGTHLDAPPERARYLAGTVLGTLRSAEPGVTDELRGHLPRDLAELFAAVPAADPARRHPDTPAPAPLTDDELRRALRDRPDWAGDLRGIARTVRLPADRIVPLLRRMRRDTRGLGRFEYRVGPGEVTFVLHTRSVRAVTDADLPLADAIDATVDGFGSGG